MTPAKNQARQGDLYWRRFARPIHDGIGQEIPRHRGACAVAYGESTGTFHGTFAKGVVAFRPDDAGAPGGSGYLKITDEAITFEHTGSASAHHGSVCLEGGGADWGFSVPYQYTELGQYVKVED